MLYFCLLFLILYSYEFDNYSCPHLVIFLVFQKSVVLFCIFEKRQTKTPLMGFSTCFFYPFDITAHIHKYMLTFRNLGLATPYPGLALVFLEEEKIKLNSSAKTFVILKCKYGAHTNSKCRFISYNFSSKR